MKDLKLWMDDPWLEPWKDAIWRRYSKSVIKSLELSGYGKPLKHSVNSHLYYGVTRDTIGSWIFREWAPNATSLYLIGDLNSWEKREEFRFSKLESGNWELILPKAALKHGDLYKWHITWNGGEGERIPAYATRTVQDEKSKLFAAQLWDPKPYKWNSPTIKKIKNPLIYEAHIGMSTQEQGVGSFNYFRENVLPRIAKLGYNTIQLMAIQEHPYYGSFGYQVSGFFAVSSRFGTPEELKMLIDEAHSLNIAVVLDIIHSHAVNNTLEGLSLFDGTEDLYFHAGERGYHPAWTSRCFNYGKSEVIHFLLSNCKYWMEEFKFDGFRFDGITSMIYYDHGLGKDFTDYSCYFDSNQDEDAITYLVLANQLIREINPDAITIAEDVSGMPGLAAPFKNGGVGFDFRMSMGVADNWIKWIKELRDEDWNVSDMFHELTNKREDEKTISYAECHDQAMVGDKTIIFRLIDSEMYTSMSRNITSLVVDRGVALHKMIRLATISTAGDGYLNFMGNEFGHPEWIDFPREGNNWSYHYARRQWSLADNKLLKYSWLLEFDRAMINLVKSSTLFRSRPEILYVHNERQILIFKRGEYIFAFNFSPLNSYPDLSLSAPEGSYKTVLDTDMKKFGGFNRNNQDVKHITLFKEGRDSLSLYLPCRSAIVLKKEKR
ncbi:MAG: 1,4-alpha-glucan-branching enzyme [Bacteroidetes bacterium HGW-Bacteroidetes-5]|jgi:1,4-alpha-glucan branching enzyme|nr:MAG: 1,4-alpha-glucan-branching enzyme [Bacteroidetes bacterium HGW-Bacteroidetes-5]